jgi:hypothetical protein
MITWALIGSAVIALVVVVLMQGKWTSKDDWPLRQSDILKRDVQAIFFRRRHQPRQSLKNNQRKSNNASRRPQRHAGRAQFFFHVRDE